MALKIHLPLINDIKNIGVSDTQPLIMGTGITYAAGKIGNAIKFPNSCASCVHMPGLKLQVFSWAAWFKVLGEGAGTSQRMLSEGRDTGSVGTNIWVSKAGTTLSWSTHKKTGSATIELNRWYHVALTADGTNVKLYLDGILKSTTPYTEDSDYAQSDNQFVLGKMSYAYTLTGSYFPFNGQLNDVRVYDECLSAATIHEIAQGLVLHYKLDSFQGGYGNPNLLPASDTNHFDTTYSFEFEGWVKNFYTTTWVNEHLTVGQQYTLSYTVTCISIPDTSIYSVSETRASPILVHQGGGWSQVTTTNDGIKSTNLLPGQSRTYKCTFTFATATESQAYYGFCGYTCLYRNADRTSSEYAKFRIDNLKLELGSDTTPWVPNVNDENVDVTHIQDSSGYNHNGEIVGTITLNSDSPRYNCSSVFNGSSYIAVGNQLYGMRDAMTVNLWCKKDWTKNTGTPFSSVQSGGFGWQCSGTNYVFYCGTGETSNTYINRTLALSGLSEGWHMLSATYDGFSLTTYIDGELINTVKKYDTKTPLYYNWNSGMFIGAESAGQLMTSGTDRFSGNISDVRVYCTPLLDTDIKQLYNVGMKVDNLGGVHSYTFSETNENILFNVEKARTNLTFTDGLRGYTQANCQVTLTEQGYHIYRPPNLTTANDGNTMWGGLLINNQTTRTIAAYDASRDNIWNLQKNHIYIFAFHAKGQSSNSPSLIVESNMGWDRIAGIGPNPTYLASKTIPTNFDGEQDCYIIFKIEDDIVKVATENKSSYVQGTSYLSYKELCLNYGYTATGTLGTDLYLTNFRLYDITDQISQVKKTGVINFSSLVEQADKAQIRKNSELLATEFIEM